MENKNIKETACAIFIVANYNNGRSRAWFDSNVSLISKKFGISEEELLKSFLYLKKRALEGKVRVKETVGIGFLKKMVGNSNEIPEEYLEAGYAIKLWATYQDGIMPRKLDSVSAEIAADSGVKKDLIMKTFRHLMDVAMKEM